jgi:hypothetical protein
VCVSTGDGYEARSPAGRIAADNGWESLSVICMQVLCEYTTALLLTNAGDSQRENTSSTFPAVSHLHQLSVDQTLNSLEQAAHSRSNCFGMAAQVGAARP